MNKKVIGLVVIMLIKSGVAFSAGTVTEYSRELPEGYRHSNEKFGNVPGSLSGPRVAWADPCALGKLRLLIVLPAGAAHEANELRSRIPAEVSLITPTHHDKWFKQSGSTLPVNNEILDTSAHRLLSRGYRYDAIIIGKVRWSAIPAEVQNKIMEKVRGGTSLVWVGPWDVSDDLRSQMGLSGPDNPLAQTIQTTVPLGMLPLDMECEKTSRYTRRIGPPEIRTGKLGGGLVVWLDYHDLLTSDPAINAVTPGMAAYDSTALTPYVADDDLYYDYYFSILGKALYHAAGKTAGVKIRAQQPVVTLARDKTASAKVAFTLELLDRELRDLEVVYELRDRRGRVRQKGPVGDLVFTGNTAAVAVPLPLLSRGTYVIDVWALQRGAVLDWASAALVVTDTKYLDKIEPAKEFFGRNERISGTVKFATPLTGKLSAEVQLWDTHGRLLGEARLENKNGEFAFPPIANPLSCTYCLTAKVMEKDFVLDQMDVWFGLPSNEVDDYQFIVWGWGYQRSSRTLVHQFKQHAVTAIYSGLPYGGAWSEQADAIARNNLLAYPYTATVQLEITPKRKFADILKSYEFVIQRVKSDRRYGPMAYTICEENGILREEESWNNPEALKDYRVYLKERYGEVAKLNEIWGAKFNSFDEIDLISFIEAKTSRQPTRWMEQELHKVDRFSQVHEHIYQLIQKEDPGARISLDCIEGMDFDWPRMARITRAMTQCPPLEYFNRDQDRLIGTWTGYYACFNQIDEWTMRTVPWKYLFKGGTHMIWWADTFTIDLSEPLLCMQQAVEEYRELESGAGKLLMSSRKRVDPILVLWSNPSYYAGILNPGEVSWDAAFKRFERMLDRIGFDFKAVGEEFLEKSLAYGDTQRVLILPASQAISRKGAAKIKAFAEAGGVVIADFVPAVMDEYLRPYGQPVAAGEVKFETCAKCQGAKRAEVGNVWQSCPACGGTGQTMKGGAAAPTESALADVFDFSRQGAKKIGKGCGLFLKGSPDRREEWCGIRKSLIEKAGLRGDVEVQDPLGHLRTDLSSYVFDNGRAVFLGVVPDQSLSNPPGENFTVKLSGKRHVYDVRRRQYLGEMDTVRCGILPTEPKLLAFLPERIAGLNLSLSKSTGKPGDVLELQGTLVPSSLKDSRLVVRIEVFKDGKIQEAYTKNLAFQGSFTYPIPLALNQERGQYHVKITEMISGYTREMEFNVK